MLNDFLWLKIFKDGVVLLIFHSYLFTGCWCLLSCKTFRTACSAPLRGTLNNGRGELVMMENFLRIHATAQKKQTVLV